MKYRTADLEGALLDAAVAKAEGMRYTRNVDQDVVIPPPHVPHPGLGMPLAFYSVCLAAPADGLGPLRIFSPSTDCAQGGPIIDRERITTVAHDVGGKTGWSASVSTSLSFYRHYIDEQLPFSLSGHEGVGPTRLIAAMRAFVASKLGPEVDLP